MNTPASYSDNVFINCPFDIAYNNLFETIIFAVQDCGFIPRCAREEDDGGNVRIIKIMKIIDECKYGIHDISKADLDISSKLARFNMPLELGLFLGAHHYAPKNHYNKEKRSLIMDVEPYRYQKFISDLSGQDILSHNNSPKDIITNIRNFLSTNSRRRTIPGGQYIFDRFNRFNHELIPFCETMHWERNALTFIEYVTSVNEWLKLNAI